MTAFLIQCSLANSATVTPYLYSNVVPFWHMTRSISFKYPQQTSHSSPHRRVIDILGVQSRKNMLLYKFLLAWNVTRIDPTQLTPTGQNWRHVADDIFRRISVNEKLCISIKISLKFGDKPFSESMMMVIHLTHICVTRPQWVKGCIQWPGVLLFILSRWLYLISIIMRRYSGCRYTFFHGKNQEPSLWNILV